MKLSDNEIQRLKNNEMKIRELRVAHFVDSDKLQVENILKLLNKNILDIQELSTLLKNGKEYFRLLESRELFKELSESNKLNKEDLRYLLNIIDRSAELDALSRNTSLLKSMTDSSTVSFQELVDKFKSMKDYVNDPCLYKLLKNEKFFEELFKNNKLTKDDLRYLLNRINSTFYEFSILCKNTSLIKEILNEFILDKEDVDRFNEMIEKSYSCKEENIHTIFECIEYYNENNEKVLKLNELNEKIYMLNSFELNEDQRNELIEVLKNSEVAQNRLIQVVDNNLEDQYSFDRLKNLLTKDEKKQKIKMNF